MASPGHNKLTLQKPVLNSLTPGRFELNFRWVIFVLNLVIDVWCISGKVALRWKSLDLTDDESTLVQVMAWCRQATSHYPSQYWPRTVSLYGILRPQWVNVCGIKPSHMVAHILAPNFKVRHEFFPFFFHTMNDLEYFFMDQKKKKKRLQENYHLESSNTMSEIFWYCWYHR